MPDGPEPLREVLSRLFAARGWGQRQGRLQLEEAWQEAAGETTAQASRPGSLRHGVLEVVVADAILMQELAHFQKRLLLDRLQATLGKQRVRDLRFRLGKVEG